MLSCNAQIRIIQLLQHSCSVWNDWMISSDQRRSQSTTGSGQRRSQMIGWSPRSQSTNEVTWNLRAHLRSNLSDVEQKQISFRRLIKLKIVGRIHQSWWLILMIQYLYWLPIDTNTSPPSRVKHESIFFGFQYLKNWLLIKLITSLHFSFSVYWKNQEWSGESVNQ